MLSWFNFSFSWCIRWENGHTICEKNPRLMQGHAYHRAYVEKKLTQTKIKMPSGLEMLCALQRGALP